MSSIQGWDDEGLDGHFTQLRQVSDNADDKLQSVWFQKLTKVAQELDEAMNFVPTMAHLQFLDVGCAPGGFSFYVLRKKSWANGVGITLPQSAGGHTFLLDRRLLLRYNLMEKDILEYDLSSQADNGPGKETFPENLLHRFHLVMLDGHALRTYHHPIPPTTPGEAKAAHGTYSHRLLIAQFIIALEAVFPGGTILVRLSHIECFPSAQLLYLLDKLSDTIHVHKPAVTLAKRGTFYVAANGVGGPGREELRKQYLEGLRVLWSDLGTGGPYGRGRMMVPGDLDFIATTETILDTYLDRLVEFGRGVWQTQIHGLRWLFKQRGIQ
ncbi:hypothetical protein C8Q76DRAFT_637362 [Earliella scabrosa]|nr:hypothetical protein C8Q76DRAFT_637362 [Earliella scabrosa]